MDRSVAPSALREMYEAPNVGHLRKSLSDQLAHLGFWGVGECINPESYPKGGYRHLRLYTWDNYASRIGDRRDELFAAYNRTHMGSGFEEEAQRLSWLATRTSPYLCIKNAPVRFKAHRERCRLVGDFGLRAADHLVLPLGQAPDGLRRMWAVAETQGALTEVDTALSLLVVYSHMSRVLDAEDRPGEPAALVPDRPVELGTHEREVLRWAAAGKTVREISIITGMSYRTVRYHIEKARTRYGYATTQQTIVRAALDYGFDPMGRR